MWRLAATALGSCVWLSLAVLPALSAQGDWILMAACVPALAALALGLRSSAWPGWHMALFPALLAVPWAAGRSGALDRTVDSPLSLALHVLALGGFVVLAARRPAPGERWQPLPPAAAAAGRGAVPSAAGRWLTRGRALVVLVALGAALSAGNLSSSCLARLSVAFPGRLGAVRVGINLLTLLAWMVVAAAATPRQVVAAAPRAVSVRGAAIRLGLLGGAAVALVAVVLEAAALHPVRAGAILLLGAALAGLSARRLPPAAPQRDGPVAVQWSEE